METIGEAGIIVVPETSQDRCTTGIILAIGPGKYLPNGQFLPTTLKAGMRVLYDLYGTQDVKLSEKTRKKVTTLRESQVRAVLERVK